MTLSAFVGDAFDIDMRMEAEIFENHNVTLFHPNIPADQSSPIDFNDATSYDYTSATWAADQQVNITVGREGRFAIPYKATSPYTLRVKEGVIWVTGEPLPNTPGQYNTIRSVMGSAGANYNGSLANGVRCGKLILTANGTVTITLTSSPPAGTSIVLSFSSTTPGPAIVDNSLSAASPVATRTLNNGAREYFVTAAVHRAQTPNSTYVTTDPSTVMDGTTLTFRVTGAGGNSVVVPATLNRMRIDITPGQVWGETGQLVAPPGTSNFSGASVPNLRVPKFGKIIQVDPITSMNWAPRNFMEVTAIGVGTPSIITTPNGWITLYGGGTAKAGSTWASTYLAAQRVGGTWRVIPKSASNTGQGSFVTSPSSIRID